MTFEVESNLKTGARICILIPGEVSKNNQDMLIYMRKTLQVKSAEPNPKTTRIMQM